MQKKGRTSRRLGPLSARCFRSWLKVRSESVGNRVVNDVKNGTGAILASQEDAGGWPAW